MKESGQFIAVEGIDGSGKTTQVELLTRYCQDKKMRVSTIKFPQYDTSFYGRITGAYLRGEFGGLNDISPYSAAILYAANRFEAVPQIRTALAQGGVLIADRYIGSNLAHQAAKLSPKEWPAFYDWLMRLEYKALGIPEPDATIMFDMPVTEAVRLMKQRPARSYTSAKRDIHEADTTYLEAVSSVYRDLADKNENWTRIECTNNQTLRPVKDIRRDVLEVLRGRGLIP